MSQSQRSKLIRSMISFFKNMRNFKINHSTVRKTFHQYVLKCLRNLSSEEKTSQTKVDIQVKDENN